MIDEPLVGRQVRIEEAVARLFELARELGGGEAYEVVVVVPSYYSEAQRNLLAQVITLAGLKPLALVNDLTAGILELNLCWIGSMLTSLTSI